MSEIESLATEESAVDHLRRHHLDRLIMLSDGVFAIAITLAAIEIRIPDTPTLAQSLASVGTDLATYFISFLVIASFWISHRDLFARLRQVDRVFTALALAMLCAVALIPAAAHGSQVRNVIGGSMRFYALVMVLSGSFNLAMWAYASARSGMMVDDSPRADRVHRIVVAATVPVLFLYVLLAPTAAAFGWIVPITLGLFIVRRRLVRRFIHAD